MATPAGTMPRARARRAGVRVGGLWAVAGVALVLGLISLLGPTAPTYDPWAWIIWGREIGHLTLDTRLGPSWKPLPVVFTTLFGPLGSAAPDLWLAVARAGGIAAIVLAFRVASRLGGGVLGGALATAALVVSTDFLRFAAVGDSEGLLVALLLAAIELQLAGRSRAALWIAWSACLLRPEAWPFAGLFALWLARRDPSTRPLVAGLVAGGAVLWFGPELWGSGDPFRAGARARDPNPNALAFADHPALAVAERFLHMLPILAEAGLVALAAGLARRRGRVEPAVRPVALLAAGAIAWLAVVCAMTEAGFSGNARYLIAPVALGCVAGGVGAGRALRLLPLGPRALAAVTALLAVGVSIGHLRPLPHDAKAVDGEAKRTARLGDALRAAGPASAIRRCGTIATGPFQVPAVAWALDVPLRRVGIIPGLPGTVVRAAPPPRTVAGAPVIALHDRRWRPASVRDPWQVVSSCPLR